MFGLGHHAPRDRQHLLLAAGQQAGAAVQPIAQPRESVFSSASISTA